MTKIPPYHLLHVSYAPDQILHIFLFSFTTLTKAPLLAIQIIFKLAAAYITT